MKEYDFLFFQELIKLLTGITIGSDQSKIVETRIEQRMGILRMNSIREYVDYLQNYPGLEIPYLISVMTTHTTHFFREEEHFEYLKKIFLPEWIKEKRTDLNFNCWSAACSSGEEVYSIAMTVDDFFRNHHPNINVKIIGSDIDIKMIEKSEKGIYKSEQIKEIQSDWQERYFSWGTGEIANFIKIKNEIKKTVKFVRLNLLSPPYFESNENKLFDVLFLRNVFIYFDKATVKKIIDAVAMHLKPQGILILGHVENLIDVDSPFTLISNSIYKFKDKVHAMNAKLSNVSISSKEEKKEGFKQKYRILIVDDSSAVRLALKKILSIEYGFVVVGEAESPIEADLILKKEKVDVITLDINMDKKDGITYLEELTRKAHPPIIMISSISKEDALSTLRAFEYGAFDYIEKPDMNQLYDIQDHIRQVITEAGQRGIMPARDGFEIPKRVSFSPITGEQHTNSEKMLIFNPFSMEKKIIVIGASTGGIVAIKSILERLRPPTPPILIVQHIPPIFSMVFAERLQGTCKIRVKEANDGEEIAASTAYIAPGGSQMRVVQRSHKYVINITSDPPVNKLRPSVDYLMFSIVDCMIKDKDFGQVVGVILTGMGADGAKGMLALRESGATTLGQDEATAVVYGMPKAAKAIGAVALETSLYEIPEAIVRACDGN
ncbi:MAG: chemotaxis-specific protein-glutamate methyltransferase CheB [Oligoflexia bacterium]|nr:chemotaxis-specific protein-glutamate methyltransferase CheB [Oligoflexia bacterium]MBF0366639.1 chemotaxis-specific protein-glutamate methyltransferase CheB [Oligoflexia bacterium]